MLPEPLADRLDPVDLAPGVRVHVERCEPLPFNVTAWHKRTLGRRVVLDVEQLETTSGWPLILVRTPDAMFGFFELFDRCAVVAATADNMAAIDAVAERVRELFLAGDIDRRQTEVVALSQLWQGHA